MFETIKVRNFNWLSYSSHLYDLATVADEVLLSDLVLEVEPSWDVDGPISSSLCANNL